VREKKMYSWRSLLPLNLADTSAVELSRSKLMRRGASCATRTLPDAAAATTNASKADGKTNLVKGRLPVRGDMISSS